MAAMSFLLYVAAGMPLLGGFCALLCAVPITFVGLRHGARRAALSCACATVLVCMLAGGFTPAYLYLNAFGVVGVASAWMLTRKSDPGRALVVAVIGLTTVLVPLTLLIGQAIGAEAPLSQGQDAMYKFMEEGVAKFNDPQFTAMLPLLKKQMTLLLMCPLLLFAFTAFLSLYSNHWVSYYTLRRMGHELHEPPNPYHIKMAPWAACLYLIVGLRLGAIHTQAPTMQMSVLVNLHTLLMFAAWSGGIAAILRMFSPKKQLPTSRFFLAGLISMPFSGIMVLLGLFDSFQPPAPADEADVKSEAKA